MHRTKLLLLVLPLIIFISCTSQNPRIVVAEYGNYKIYLDDFEKAYARNSGGIEKAKTDSLSSYQTFLDLYLNYKLKLRDAEVRGYTKDADMQKELRLSLQTSVRIKEQRFEPTEVKEEYIPKFGIIDGIDLDNLRIVKYTMYKLTKYCTIKPFDTNINYALKEKFDYTNNGMGI